MSTQDNTPETGTEPSALNEVLHQAIDAVVTIDQANQVTFFNPAAERLWGYDADEVIGQNVKILVPEIIRGQHDDMVNANRTTGVDKIVGTSREVEVHRKDGTVAWGLLSLSRVKNANGDTHYTAFVKDVTADRRRREMIRQTLDQALDAVVTIDSDNNVTFFNPAAETLWGYDADEVMGKNVRMLVPQVHQAQHDNFVNANRTTGVNKIVGTGREVEVHRKDGSLLWGLLTLSKLEFDGEINYTAFVKDVTAEKRSREMITQTLTQALDAVVTIDGDNNVTFFNPAAETLWGYSANEVIGKNVRMLVPSIHQSQHDNFVNANRTTGVNKIVGTGREVEVHRKDGSVGWGFLSLSKVKVGDEISYTAFVRDINEEVRLRGEAERERRRLIDGVVTDASELLQAIARGDLRTRMTGEYGEDFESLTTAINDCANSLSEIVTEIRSAAVSIESGAQEVLNSNHQLNERTESQASALEETSASMEEMTQSVASNATNAREVESLTEGAVKVATEGNTVVGSAIEATHSIRESSERIGDITNVINEIAFQTNLLALNASIEAARAGEHGRGFAVVAQEVRALAQRSADAAKEIKVLIQDSTERVNTGASLVGQAGERLQEIVKSVDGVNTYVTQIASACAEQAEGINLVSGALVHMDKSTQETSGLANAAANCSRSMSDSARRLSELVQHFELQGEGHGGVVDLGSQHAHDRMAS
ncbi:MAG: PAS domain S-box protein [Pseudomonadota bacterium]